MLYAMANRLDGLHTIALDKWEEQACWPLLIMYAKVC